MQILLELLATFAHVLILQALAEMSALSNIMRSRVPPMFLRNDMILKLLSSRFLQRFDSKQVAIWTHGVAEPAVPSDADPHAVAEAPSAVAAAR